MPRDESCVLAVVAPVRECPSGWVSGPEGCIAPTTPITQAAAQQQPEAPIPRVRSRFADIRLRAGYGRGIPIGIALSAQFPLLAGIVQPWGVFLGFELGGQYLFALGSTPEGPELSLAPIASFRYRVADAVEVAVRGGVELAVQFTPVNRQTNADLFIQGVTGAEAVFWISNRRRIVLGTEAIFGYGVTGFGYFGVSP